MPRVRPDVLIAFVTACLVGVLGLPATALASGTVSPSPFPDAPPVDADALPTTGRARPNMPDGRRHPVEVQLLVGPATVAPGDTISLGIRLDQDEGWHTYWQAPGDIGLPTEITWHLPEGSTVAPRSWPVPQRFEYEGIISYGYDGEVVHGFDVTLPDALHPGRHPIAADVSWLVCKEACIPGESRVEGTLLVAAESGPGPHAAVLDHWRTRWPIDDPTLDVRAEACSVQGDQFALAFALHAAGGVTRQGVDPFPAFLPIAGHPDRMIDEVVVKDDGDGLLVGLRGTAFGDIPTADDPGVGGLVQVQLGRDDVRSEILAPMPRGTASPTADGPCRVFGDDPVAAADPHAVPTPPDPGHPAPSGHTLPATTASTAAASAASTAPLVVLGNLLFAFVGGLLLNIMPCVLPVLALKLYGLVEQGGISDADKRQAGLLYTAGILVSFWVLAAGVAGARIALGGGVGWGFQFQEPTYVAFLAAVVFLFALNLFGVFEVPALGGSTAHELQGKDGAAGYFFTGVFATLVATPCSAPFLGTAIAFAFQASLPMLVAVFSLIGLGLASPFLVVAFVPAAYRLLPTPGPWMEAFKQLMGFTLIATAVWLTGVLGALIGLDQLTGFLGFLTVVALGAWVLGRYADVGASTPAKLRALLGATLLVTLGGSTLLDLRVLPPEDCGPAGDIPESLSFDEAIPWQAFSEERVADLAGRTLFLDFTADWCLTCKANEATVLASASVREAMARHHVVPLQGDWTRRDPRITDWLARFGRAGVPMYVVIPPSGLDDAILLPEVITPGMVTQALDDAAARAR